MISSHSANFCSLMRSVSSRKDFEGKRTGCPESAVGTRWPQAQIKQLSNAVIPSAKLVEDRQYGGVSTCEMFKPQLLQQPIVFRSRTRTGRAASMRVAASSTSERLAEVESLITSFTMEGSATSKGILLIRPLEGKDVQPVSEILVDSFRDILGRAPRVRVKKLLLDDLKAVPKAVCLVATTSGSNGGKEKVVGSVELSFTPDTRDEEKYTPPPADAAYLSNMAVDASTRR
ncbi:hypothetical protein CYMTET_34384 [Cymbomonas tetramitiformis]|uniref:Uncharacterized protein n=1 Tax=Cymbomonas tetramitiformis TaxID=36881 RepID=A0AAE0FBC6_9CHLO|nr:hypothetical protein CYMTET_34384 [Cymbomonas tetramitiformis]